MDKVIVYYGWAMNDQGKIEGLRIERAGGQAARGFAPNPHRRQQWTGRVFMNGREAMDETRKLNGLA